MNFKILTITTILAYVEATRSTADECALAPKQTKACAASGGVCTIPSDCLETTPHPSENTCEEGFKCCVTSEVVQMHSCYGTKTNSICSYDSDCPASDRHEAKCLCGDQMGVSCCSTRSPRSTGAEKNEIGDGAVDDDGKVKKKKRANPKKRTTAQTPCAKRGGVCIKNGICDVIIKEVDSEKSGLLCEDPEKKCCVIKQERSDVTDAAYRATMRQLGYYSYDDLGDQIKEVKRDSKSIPIRHEIDDDISEKDVSKRSEISGVSCGTRKGECATKSICSHGFEDIAGSASCEGAGQICCTHLENVCN